MLTIEWPLMIDRQIRLEREGVDKLNRFGIYGSLSFCGL